MSDYSHLFRALPERLLPWYEEHARALPWRENNVPYFVWLSEIMLQQTRIEAARGYFLRFIDAFPTVEALGAAAEDTVLKYWEGLGYYSRARNLYKAAQIIVQKYGGSFPSSYAEIAALPGIGPYTAGAIASICFDAPTPAVDGNVLRLAARLTNAHVPVDTPVYRKEVTSSLAAVYPKGACGRFTQSLMEIGETVCVPSVPHCSVCPLSALCLSFAAGTSAKLPLRTPKKARRIVEKTVFFLRFEDRIAIRRRGNTGLLAGLWELPNVDTPLSAEQALKKAAAWYADPAAPFRTADRIHVFTHVEWHMRCFYITCMGAHPSFTWANKTQLRDTYALPTAFRIFME